MRRLLHDASANPVTLRSELRGMGLTDRAIADLRRSGELHRVRRGAYVAGELWRSATELERHGLLARAVLNQAGSDVVLSHVSALPEWEALVWDVDLVDVHVTRRDRRGGRHERGVHQHIGVLLPEDVVLMNGVAVTSATRTGLDVTSMLDTERSLVVMDDLLRRGLTTPGELASRYATMTHWPNTLRTDLVLRLSDGRSESVGETRARYLCWGQGLPAPIPQLEVFDARGRLVGRVDLAWPEHGVWLEFDGKIKYEVMLRDGERASDAVIREKQREQEIAEITGWRCIRLDWADLYRPEQTAARIRRLLYPGASAA